MSPRRSDDPRRWPVSMRLTDSEIKTLRALAAARGCTLSDALRAVLRVGVDRLLREMAATERKG